MIQSKFRYGAILPIMISLVLFLVLITAIGYFYDATGAGSFILVLFVFLILAFFLTWIVWGELRTKAVKISIAPDTITTINFMGFGVTKNIEFSAIDGIRMATLSSEYSNYEYLYVIRGKRKVVKLSEFYHKNYPELKKALLGKCKYLGTEQFSLSRELKEIFQ